MTIVIVPSQPIGRFGPGLGITLSAATFPIPTGSFWSLSFSPSSDTSIHGWFEKFKANNSVEQLMLGTSGSIGGTFAPQHQFQGDEQVKLTVDLGPDVGIQLENGTFTAPWEPLLGLGYLLGNTRSSVGAGQGLTTEQAQQIQETHAAVAPSINLDQTTLSPLNGAPTNGPITASLPNWCFGVIVRITSIPPDLLPSTPDGLYWVHDLAVVRVFRGSDLWLRVPIHTESKLIGFASENLVVGAATAVGLEWLLQISVQVTFRPGVLGNVFVMNHP